MQRKFYTYYGIHLSPVPPDSIFSVTRYALYFLLRKLAPFSEEMVSCDTKHVQANEIGQNLIFKGLPYNDIVLASSTTAL